MPALCRHSLLEFPAKQGSSLAASQAPGIPKRLCLLGAGTAFWRGIPKSCACPQQAQLFAIPKRCACARQAQLCGRKSPKAVPAPSRRSFLEFQKLCLRSAGTAFSAARRFEASSLRFVQRSGRSTGTKLQGLAVPAARRHSFMELGKLFATFWPAFCQPSLERAEKLCLPTAGTPFLQYSCQLFASPLLAFAKKCQRSAGKC